MRILRTVSDENAVALNDLVSRLLGSYPSGDIPLGDKFATLTVTKKYNELLGVYEFSVKFRLYDKNVFLLILTGTRFQNYLFK